MSLKPSRPGANITLRWCSLPSRSTNCGSPRILDVILESCVTKIFLANPDMDRDLYQRQFHLNDHEIELIAGLIPKQQMLIKTPDAAKVANLNVDAKSYWLYTNDPFDNRKRDQAFATHGFEQGLEVLAALSRAETSS